MVKKEEVRGWVALALAAALGACSPAAAGESEAVLPGSQRSVQALATAAWEATVAGDTVAMDRLRLSEREHNELVWPHLPAARPGLNMPVDFAWQNLQMRNHWDRAKLLRLFRGSRAHAEAAGCADTAVHGSIQVLSGCWLEVREPGRTARRVMLFDDVLQLGGELKLFRYRSE